MKISACALAALVVTFALNGCGGVKFPAVQNPDQLVKDCDALLAGGQNRMLPPEQWPDSIRALKPVYVCVNDTDVMIATQAGGDKGASGFFVSHGTPFTGHQTLTSTPDANIYHFEWAR